MCFTIKKYTFYSSTLHLISLFSGKIRINSSHGKKSKRIDYKNSQFLIVFTSSSSSLSLCNLSKFVPFAFFFYFQTPYGKTVSVSFRISKYSKYLCSLLCISLWIVVQDPFTHSRRLVIAHDCKGGRCCIVLCLFLPSLSFLCRFVYLFRQQYFRKRTSKTCDFVRTSVGFFSPRKKKRRGFVYKRTKDGKRF